MGKSTLVQEWIRQTPEKKWVRLNMDSRGERLQVENDRLEPLIEDRALQKIDAEKPLWVAVDEAQKSPQLFEQIKILYDRYKETPAVKFILTGSGSLDLHRLSAESLAGRIQIYYLREFCLSEWAALCGHPLPPPASIDLLTLLWQGSEATRLREMLNVLRPFSKILKESLIDQLVWGGLPELRSAGETPEPRIRYLADYLQTYLEKDVRDLETVSDLNLYQRLMEILAEQTGSLRDDKKILEALGCNRETLKKYRGYLESTLVYREVFPFIRGTLHRLVKSPKGYMTNNGLISHLTGLYDFKVLEKTGLIGHRFENWAFRELQTWLDARPERSGIHFWRTSGGVEVDLVASLNPKILPVEITWSQKKDPQKIRHLHAFLSDHSEAPFGMILYNGDYDFDPKTRIHFVPAWALG